eukprot:324307_1
MADKTAKEDFTVESKQQKEDINDNNVKEIDDKLSIGSDENKEQIYDNKDDINCDNVTSVKTLNMTDMPSTIEFTPLTKLNNNLLKYLSEQTKEEYTFAVLLTTGALNPIHLGHVDIMESAKIELESQHKNVKVIGGFMSASHDDYVGGKFGRNKYIPSEYRLKMVEMATTYSDWISCDEWECRQNYFVDYPQVASRLNEALKEIYCDKNKYIKENNLKIYYVCGLDHATNCGLLGRGLNYLGVNTLIVRRPNAKLNQIKLKSNLKNGVVVVDVPPVDYDRSSTMVRNLLSMKKWKDLEKYLHIKVLQYLKDDPDKMLCKIKF